MPVLYHKPVLPEEVMRLLDLKKGDYAMDGTAGNGGHCVLMARAIGSGGALLGLDRDPAMLAIAKRRVEEEISSDVPRLAFVNSSFHQVEEALENQLPGVRFHGILLDLGLNSLQLEDGERGFSFMQDGPLDGRFGPQEGGISIAQLLETADEADIARWLWELGDERHSRQIARAIVRVRKTTPITRTLQLAELVTQVYPPRERKGRIHPATKTFMALRMVVNQELEVLEEGLRACLRVLEKGGRLAVISFHSKEDRLVKAIFDEMGSPKEDPSNPYQATTTEGLEYRVLSRGAIKPSRAEMDENPRARSARLRVIERLEVAA